VARLDPLSRDRRAGGLLRRRVLRRGIVLPTDPFADPVPFNELLGRDDG
jgi:hypothetical protein